MDVCSHRNKHTIMYIYNYLTLSEADLNILHHRAVFGVDLILLFNLHPLISASELVTVHSSVIIHFSKLLHNFHTDCTVLGCLFVGFSAYKYFKARDQCVCENPAAVILFIQSCAGIFYVNAYSPAPLKLYGGES